MKINPVVAEFISFMFGQITGVLRAASILKGKIYLATYSKVPVKSIFEPGLGFVEP